MAHDDAIREVSDICKLFCFCSACNDLMSFIVRDECLRR